jgi:5-formyltetrahydrofolate cyclo-ligase
VADSSDRADAKARVRRQVAAALARLSPDRRRAAAIAVVRHLQTLPAVTEAGTVMAFLSLPTEIDTWPVIRWAWDCGKRVAIPRVDEAQAGAAGREAVRTMAPVLLEPADAASAAAHPAVRPGAFGILTAPDAPLVPAGEIDVVLVPCTAVDRRGNRLGKGGGFYDRFLARPEVRAVRIAPAFGEQVLGAVPVGERDKPVDMIVTEDGVLRFNRPGAGPAASENPTGEE